MDNGAELYHRFLLGEDEALVDIVRAYQDGLLQFLIGYVKDVSLAEELMQETFFKLVTKKPSFKSQASFKTWLYTIARNAALDELRHQKRFSIDSMDEIEQITSEAYDAEKIYLKKEEHANLIHTMEKLPSSYRQVLFLLYFEKFTFSDVCKIMKKSSRQVKNITYRAKLALKNELEKEGFQYEEL